MIVTAMSSLRQPSRPSPLWLALTVLHQQARTGISFLIFYGLPVALSYARYLSIHILPSEEQTRGLRVYRWVMVPARLPCHLRA